MAATLRRQAALLTAANVYSRAMGFGLRLIFARLMGAEALGVMELAGSVGMLALTPMVAGVPAAVSRLTARVPAASQQDVLRAGRRYVLRMALVLTPLTAVLSPALAWLLGDRRTIPALLALAPGLGLMGLCGVYAGYAIGLARPSLPALGECVEQTLRCLLVMALLLLPVARSTALTAAIPGVAQAAASAAAVLLYRRALRPASAVSAPRASMEKELLALAVPMMAARLFAAGMRAIHAVLLPVCLTRSGLTAAAATAQYGMLNGMAMPLIMAPGVVTGALCTVATPAVSRLERSPKALRGLSRRLLLAGGVIGAACSAVLFLLAEPLTRMLFRQPGLAPLVRLLSPMALLVSLRQIQSGMLAGLGLQRRLLTGTLISSTVSLAVTALLAPMPQLRLMGAGLGMLAGHTVEWLWGAVVLTRRLFSAPGRGIMKASDRYWRDTPDDDDPTGCADHPAAAE